MTGQAETGRGVAPGGDAERGGELRPQPRPIPLRLNIGPGIDNPVDDLFSPSRNPCNRCDRLRASERAALACRLLHQLQECAHAALRSSRPMSLVRAWKSAISASDGKIGRAHV